jgi:hypothetical protein
MEKIIPFSPEKKEVSLPPIFSIIPAGYLPKHLDCNACVTCKDSNWLLNEVITPQGTELEAKCYCKNMFIWAWDKAKENVHICQGNPTFTPNLTKLKLNNKGEQK